MSRRLIPWTICAVFAAYVAAPVLGWRATSRDGFDLATFARLPVAIGARVRPIDSVARMGLLQVRGTVDVPLADNAGAIHIGGSRLSATEWLLELLVKPDVADTRRVFPIGDPAVLAKIRLQAAPAAGGYYTFTELAPRDADIAKEADRIRKVDPATRAPWEKELIALRTRLVAYERLKNSLQANSLLQREAKGAALQYDLAEQLATYRGELADVGRLLIRRQQGKPEALDTQKAAAITGFARPFAAVSRMSAIAMIPPFRPEDSRDGWKNVGAVIVDSARTGRLPAPVTQLAAITSAFARGKPAAFNRLVNNYDRWLASNALAPAARRARYEFFYNLLRPYAKAVSLYLVALLLACASWRRRSATLYRSALLVAFLALGIHAVGLLLDMMLSGQLPVFNRLALLVVVSWALVAGALALERSSGRGRALAAGAGIGLLTLVGAHALAPGGITLLVANVVDVPFMIAIAATLLVLPLGRARAIEVPAGAAPVPA
jgi:hypothetical protein